ncbi:exonuclease SbcCD subunit D [Methanosarcina sp. MSH10X1]|uniref:metallophosphoesterase family protein n=1 Tax=Methanosarcina sp. MSH10X1 TaxID=2507075 RepID=UPI000FFB5C13|nr:exonuclease SbcCD subunit D [Methanosarcina sp. MSH10X1]RXA20089.1 exonuclease SbcCD subunit D [Methanosarcina sp. MSH10X1]
MAREIRILHTADTHLGYRQYHSEARRRDFFAAFELVVNDAVEMQVDAVVHAGDLFDSRNPTLEDLLETMNILARLRAAGIPFFGIVGNHESKQSTQWLDLFEEMGLAARLGKKPLMVSNAAIYGIDSVPKSKIPIFDYSGFEEPDSTLSTLSNPSIPAKNCWKLLVMHQIVNPFPYAEWDCDEVLENLPFGVDAILLGDYHEHAITKNKTGETWITYPGSTERNAVSEKDARSYNLITLSEKGVEISRRTIPTRNFLSIPVELNGEDKPYEQIFSRVSEYLEEIPESVVHLEISGDSGIVLSQSELEEYLLKKGALVSNVKDRRTKESIPEEVLKVAFSDPDHAVADEIGRMSLNDGGLIIDEIVRSPNISRSRVDEETEGMLSKLIEAKAADFRSPDFGIEIPASPAVEFSGETGLAGKFRPAGIIAGELEITELSGVLRTSDGNEDIENKLPRKGIEALAASNPGNEIEFLEAKDNETESKSETELESKSDSKPETEPETEPESKSDSKPETEPESNIETKPEIKPVSGLAESKPEKETRKLPELGDKGKPEMETPGKTEKLPEEKPARATELIEKGGKTGQNKGKGKSAIPRQYNLGDYL